MAYLRKVVWNRWISIKLMIQISMGSMGTAASWVQTKEWRVRETTFAKKLKLKNSCQCKYSARVQYNYLFFADLKKGVLILGECKYAGVVSHQRFLWGPAWEAKIALKVGIQDRRRSTKDAHPALFGGRYIGENNHRWCVSSPSINKVGQIKVIRKME